MANEILLSFAAGKNIYALIFNRTGQVFRTDTNVFEAYVTANYSVYTVSLTQQGTASPFYEGNFPAQIAAGTYSVAGRQQLGGSALETDPSVATGNIEWNGTAIAPLSDTATSGLVGQIGPIRMARGTMVQNFPFKLVSSADHVTPFTSGVCSGQISRDGGAFGALQSGAFTEMGLGWYKLAAFTSGDLLANTAAVELSAVGISGGSADNRSFSMVLQRTSGQ